MEGLRAAFVCVRVVSVLARVRNGNVRVVCKYPVLIVLE
jgi:hypothetical protein